MTSGKSLITAAAMAAFCSVSTLQAATVPFTEDFVADNAGWKDAASADLAYVAAGGPDGSSYVSGTFSFAASVENDTPVLMRGQDNFDASGDAFVGDWISEGVTELTAWVRHNAPMPLTFFSRSSKPANFPGGVAVVFGVAMPNVWTEVVFDVSATSPQFVTFEGSDYNTIFSGIGNVQFGVMVPAALEGFTPPVTFDLDQPTITPEPASLGLFAAGALVMLRCRR